MLEVVNRGRNNLFSCLVIRQITIKLYLITTFLQMKIRYMFLF